MHINPTKTCVDCGASLKNPNALRCLSCAATERWRKHREEKGHLAPDYVCIDCGKRLKNSAAIRCHSCDMRNRYDALRATRTPPNPSGLCMCGCGEPVPRAGRTNITEGVVKGEFIKFLTGHHRRLSPVEYIVDEKTGCWNWQRAIDRKGYGMVKFARGGGTGAHRFIYERHRGPIPDGMQLDHLCRNRRCVNPDHLEPVSCAENLRRGSKTRLTAQDAADIRWLYATGMYKQRDIALHFRIAPAYVSQIVKGTTWTTS